MNARLILALGAAGVLLTACIPSVNPFYTSGDITFVPGLLGTWTEGSTESSESWTFERLEGEDTYTLTIASDSEHGTFDATLFTLGGDRFLDILASKVDFADDQINIVNVSVFPGHLVLHVAALEAGLKLAFMDGDWLDKYLDANPNALHHRREQDNLLLTGSTRELQRFLRKHVDDGELFSDYSELARSTAGDSE
jgi:hypothetical protein